MVTIAPMIGFHARRANPAAYYPYPGAVVVDGSLTRGQRLEVLHDWALDMVDRQIAADEGMPASLPDSDAMLFRQINACIETVEASPREPATPVVRLLRRLLAI